MPRRRVVITGIGPITAFGAGIDPLWDALTEGRSAIGAIRAFDAGGFRCRVAAEMADGLFRVRAAIGNAGLVTKAVDADGEPTIDPDRFGCHIGAGLISADVDELAAALMTSERDGTFDLADWGASGMQNLTPLWLLKYLPNMLACHVTIVHDCRGPSNTITCCEASSALSLGESMRTVERGAADACLTGGAEYKLNLMAYKRQELTGRLAEGGAGEAVPRPFDPRAAGTVLGEGGGLLVVEAEEVAERRGARPYAAIAGFAATQSFCPDTVGLALDPDDPAIADVIELALADAAIEPADVDAIVPFASSIPSVDAAERAAIIRVFGPRASEIPIVTTVPNVGNCNAGNSAVALCVGAKCLREQRLPARLHTSGAEGLDADAAPSRTAELRNVLVFTSSQGGQNAAVVLEAS
jgi:3-oxoacyl-[acyl-carrier-protein] synthase II